MRTAVSTNSRGGFLKVSTHTKDIKIAQQIRDELVTPYGKQLTAEALLERIVEFLKYAGYPSEKLSAYSTKSSVIKDYREANLKLVEKFCAFKAKNNTATLLTIQTYDTRLTYFCHYLNGKDMLNITRKEAFDYYDALLTCEQKLWSHSGVIKSCDEERSRTLAQTSM